MIRRATAPLLAASICIAAIPAAAQHSLEMVEENGPPGNRVDLVVLADGYTEEQQESLITHTDAVIEDLFGYWPFAEYRGLFNIAQISTVSPEAGADHPSSNQFVDTAFDCSYDCWDIEYLICCDDAEILAVAAEVYPPFDVAVLVVNDPAYGGSGGPVTVVSTSPWASGMPTHEMGHTMAGLIDEYETPYPGFVFTDVYPNASPTADPADLKWAHWVEEGTPIPTPDDAGTGMLSPVGAYEGCAYTDTGVYRPVPTCIMRDLSSDMCPICAEATTLAFFESVEIVDDLGPSEAEVSLADGDQAGFWVDPIEPGAGEISLEWLLDGQPVGDGGPDLSVQASDLAPGAHVLEIRAEHRTPFVRDDPGGLLSQTASWTLARSGDAGAEDAGGGKADPDPSCGCDAAGGRRASFVGLIALAM